MSELYDTLKQGLEDAINHNVIEWVQVRHGHWERSADMFGNYYKCSVCDSTEDIGWGFDYCPNCGAKMDEEAQDASV